MIPACRIGVDRQTGFRAHSHEPRAAIGKRQFAQQAFEDGASERFRDIAVVRLFDTIRNLAKCITYLVFDPGTRGDPDLIVLAEQRHYALKRLEHLRQIGGHVRRTDHSILPFRRWLRRQRARVQASVEQVQR